MACVRTKFFCDCGKHVFWLGGGETSRPCPNCGRTYIGYYDRNVYNIKVSEVVNSEQQ